MHKVQYNDLIDNVQGVIALNRVHEKHHSSIVPFRLLLRPFTQRLQLEILWWNGLIFLGVPSTRSGFFAHLYTWGFEHFISLRDCTLALAERYPSNSMHAKFHNLFYRSYKSTSKHSGLPVFSVLVWWDSQNQAFSYTVFSVSIIDS